MTTLDWQVLGTIACVLFALVELVLFLWDFLPAPMRGRMLSTLSAKLLDVAAWSKWQAGVLQAWADELMPTSPQACDSEEDENVE